MNQMHRDHNYAVSVLCAAPRLGPPEPIWE